jgi:hypothetical protein
LVQAIRSLAEFGFGRRLVCLTILLLVHSFPQQRSDPSFDVTFRDQKGYWVLVVKRLQVRFLGSFVELTPPVRDRTVIRVYHHD